MFAVYFSQTLLNLKQTREREKGEENMTFSSTCKFIIQILSFFSRIHISGDMKIKPEMTQREKKKTRRKKYVGYGMRDNSY